MYEEYVLRKEEKTGKYCLEKIKAEEALWSAIFKRRFECLIPFSIYRDLGRHFSEIFNSLTELEVRILKFRFGFYGKFYSLCDTGKEIGLTGERVRQIEKRVLRKFRHPSRSRRLRYAYKREYLMSSEKDEMEMKIIVKKIGEYLADSNSHMSFFTSILEKNNLNIICESTNIGTAPEDISIDEMGFSYRTYNCLNNNRVRTMADILKMSEADFMNIWNFGKKCLDEVMSKIDEYKAGRIKIIYKDREQDYKFGGMNVDDIAEGIFKILEGYSPYGTIYDYEMSFELKYLLLFKGYFFLEKMIEESEEIEVELRLGRYNDYIEEFRDFVKKLRDCMNDVIDSDVEFVVVDNKSAKNIISRNPGTRKELYECLKTKNEGYNENLRKFCMEKIPEIISLDVANNVILREIDDTMILDLEDEEIYNIVEEDLE